MDTNYPGRHPARRLPVEIQALWIRLLRQVESVCDHAERQSWGALAEQALDSADKLFWREGLGYYADLLAARPGQPPPERSWTTPCAATVCSWPAWGCRR